MLSPTYIVSSNIDAIGYQLGTLFIRFKSGVTYSYEQVPFDYFDALQKVESAGQFFHKMIKKNKKFRYTKLEGDPFQAA